MRIYRVLLVFVVTGLAACQATQQIAQDIASAAPPAVMPSIALQDPLDIESGSVGVTRWPGEAAMYVRSEQRRFSLILTGGQYNAIEFTVAYGPVSNGALTITKTFAPGDAVHDAEWTYVRDSSTEDAALKRWTSRFTFYSPVVGPDVLADGRAVWIRAKEESINPAYRNTPSQFAESIFQIIPIAAGGCTVAVFQVNSGPAGYVDTKIRGCKEYVLDANGVEIRRERSSSSRGTFPPDPTPTIGTGYPYTGADTIRLVAVDAVRREVFANRYKVPSSKPPCLTSTTVDTGDGKKTKFRVPC